MNKLTTFLLGSIFIFLSFFYLCTTNTPATNIELQPLFSDNMVVQQNSDVPIWGTCNPRGEIIAQFREQRRSTLADKDGNWRLNVPTSAAGGPFELKIMGQDTITFRNVMVGEVWLCSGQSNMKMPLAGWGKVLNYEQEIAEANYPNIRLFTVEQKTSFEPLKDIPADGWVECSPATIAEFSSTAYFFGRHLFEKLNIPIGLIHSAWGGTYVEAWTSSDALKNISEFSKVVDFMQDSVATPEQMEKNYQQQLSEWFSVANKVDPGMIPGQTNFTDPALVDTAWKTMDIPNAWENAGLENFDGVVWFRKNVTIPPSFFGGEITLKFGRIDDINTTYLNGTEIGFTDRYSRTREYSVPDSVLQIGENLITLRVIDTQGLGGLRGSANQYWLVASTGDSISLAGEWRYRQAISFEKLPSWPYTPEGPNFPTALYNAMINPLVPYAIRGVIWYQGESNASRAYQYRTLFPTMINDWRLKWGEGNFPFLFVQLANYMEQQTEPVDDAWAELREAQLMTLALPNTGMAVTIDIGDADDIHPKNKQEVGRRLALLALDNVYNKNIVSSGPIYDSMTISDSTIYLTFKHADGGLTAKGDSLVGFSIAGDDQQFHRAEAKIVGDSIMVTSPMVPNPVAVRYAWASNPIANLYNQVGLPASPFRTDNWRGITQRRR